MFQPFSARKEWKICLDISVVMENGDKYNLYHRNCYGVDNFSFLVCQQCLKKVYIHVSSIVFSVLSLLQHILFLFCLLLTYNCSHKQPTSDRHLLFKFPSSQASLVKKGNNNRIFQKAWISKETYLIAPKNINRVVNKSQFLPITICCTKYI